MGWSGDRIKPESVTGMARIRNHCGNLFRSLKKGGVTTIEERPIPGTLGPHWAFTHQG